PDYPTSKTPTLSLPDALPISRLLRDDERHRGLAVEARARALLLRLIGRVADIGNLDGVAAARRDGDVIEVGRVDDAPHRAHGQLDRKSTRLNSSHSQISYAVF